MKKYVEYKESGIKWIGEIPSEWEVTTISRIFNIKAGGDLKKDLYSEIQTEVYKYPIFTNSVTADSVYGFSKTAFFYGNSITVTGRGDIGFAIYRDVPYDAIIRLLVLTPKKNEHCKYFSYFINAVIKFSVGSSAINQLSTQQISPYKVCLPSREQQQSIADYLDGKTAGIDTLIADKQKLINLLREKRQATISEAVTKGIDKTVKMKDSGIAWIGEIPAHWDVLSNHQLFVERNQKNTDANAELLSVTKYLGVILQSLAQELRLATTAPADSTEGYKIVKKGDLVMNIMRAKDGSYGISSYDGVISPAYCIYQARKKCNPQFLYYLFKTPKYVQIFKCYSTGIAEHRMRLYPEDFNQIPAILPPIVEQDEIVKKLDAESKQIDEVIALTEQQVEKLKEYRLSIISEAVTGKVAV